MRRIGESYYRTRFGARKPMTFDRKGIYHSELVKAGPQLISLKGEPRQSKDGDSWYVYLTVQGSSVDHYYTIENDTILDTLRQVPTGKWVTIEAVGSRETAQLFVSDEAGPVLPGEPVVEPDEGYEPMGQPVPPPSPRQQTDWLGQIGNQYYECLVAAQHVEAQFTKVHGPISPDVRAMASSLFIERSKRGV